jgi:hypothetical protein
MKKIFLVCLFLLIPVVCFSASADLLWHAVPGATGYKIWQSVNNGVSWTMVKDVSGGTVVTTTLTNVPDTGLVLFRFSAYSAQNETIRMDAGVWFNGTWKPLPVLTGPGIQ